MSQEQYTSLQRPSEVDPLLEQLFTPDTAINQGWMFISRQSASGLGITTEFMLYARKKPGEVTHFVVTLSHIVIALTTVRQIAEYAGKRQGGRKL